MFNNTISIDKLSDSYLSLFDVFEATQQFYSAIVSQEQDTNENRNLLLIANWNLLNNSSILFKSCLNLPDSVPITIDCQLLQTIDLSLSLSRKENLITAAEFLSHVLLSNFWQTKEIPLFLYSSKENVVTVAGFSNNVLLSNVEQINRLRNNINLFTFLSEVLFAATERSEKKNKKQTI